MKTDRKIINEDAAQENRSYMYVDWKKMLKTNYIHEDDISESNKE